jgi:hypothetical protein
VSDLTVKDVQRIAEELKRFERVVRIWRECWEDTSPARCTHAVAAARAARRFLPIVQALADSIPAPAVAVPSVSRGSASGAGEGE